MYCYSRVGSTVIRKDTIDRYIIKQSNTYHKRWYNGCGAVVETKRNLLHGPKVLVVHSLSSELYPIHHCAAKLIVSLLFSHTKWNTTRKHYIKLFCWFCLTLIYYLMVYICVFSRRVVLWNPATLFHWQEVFYMHLSTNRMVHTTAFLTPIPVPTPFKRKRFASSTVCRLSEERGKSEIKLQTE